MAGLDIGSRSLASADAVQEVLQVRVRQLAGVGRESLARVVDFPAAAVDDQRAFFAVKRDARPSPLDTVVAPQPVLPGDRMLGVVERGNHRVGRFGVLVENVVAAGRGHAFGQANIQPPAGDVQQMDSPVTQLTSAVVLIRSPVMMEAVRVESSLWSRAKPEVVVNSCGS